MQCITPHTMRQGGKNITVSCRVCMPCRVNHAQDWRFRLEKEMMVAQSAHFITLTYADEYITRNDLGHSILIKSDLQKFIKRIRKHTKTLENVILNGIGMNELMRFPPIRYYAVGEYGGESYRAHYHLIMYNVPFEVLKMLTEIWQFGHVYIGTVTSASIQYVTKYITKIDSREIEEMEIPRPFNLMSKGLGENYVNDATKAYHSQLSTMSSVKKKFEQRLPKYYMPKVHDLDNWETQMKLNHSKAKLSRKFRKADNELHKKLRQEAKEKNIPVGAYISDYHAQQKDDINSKLTRSTKKHKL